MSSLSSRPALRLTPLAACLSIAFALGSTSMPLLAAVRVVQNCTDGGPGSGSLRDMVGIANSGDTIDLRQLPAKCGMAQSTITLDNGEIVMNQQDLELQGPDPRSGSVTIVPALNKLSRVLAHTGSGFLTIESLTVANGNLQVGASIASGGCIKSDGDIFLGRSIVTGCKAVGESAYGGGLYAKGSVTIFASTVSSNTAIGNVNRGSGGGVFAGKGLTIFYSTVSANEASTFGGGAYTKSVDAGVYTYIVNSTLDANTAEQCGGGALYTGAGITISNSTISGNIATDMTGGVCAGASLVSVQNSTIASNAESLEFGAHAGGIKISTSGGSAILQSSIIANNASALGSLDLYVSPDTSISGKDNLVVTANANLPPGVVTLTSEPKMGPLQFNGGRTRTHALLPSSPAIGAGNNTGGFATDQRGRGYPRTSGPSSSVDIGAFQFDSIFAHDFEW